MKKFLLLCLTMVFIAPIAAARPVLTKAKWEQMQQGNAQKESIVPETRPMLIEDVEDIEELDQTPPPLPPRPTTQPVKGSVPTLAEQLQEQSQKLKPVTEQIKVTPPPLPPRPVTPPPLPPRPTAQQPMMTGVTKEQAAKPGLPFSDQDLTAQAGKLKKPIDVQQTKEPLGSFKEKLQEKFKGASGSEDEESETEEWEWED